MQKRFPMLAVLLAFSALMPISGQNLNGQEDLPACEGAGIYRSFNLVRQFKLATAYFVNPSLPDRVRISYAYNLEEAIGVLGSKAAVAKRIESEEMQLSLPVNRDVAWAPSSYRSHCYLSNGSVDVRVVEFSYTPVSAPENLMRWLDNLPPEDTAKFHVLSDNDFGPGADDRVITWAPDESVVVIRNDGVTESERTREPGVDSAPDR